MSKCEDAWYAVQRSLPLARRFHWSTLPLHRLPLHWTYCPRNRCTATIGRPVRVVLGPLRGRDLLERDWNIKPDAVPDIVAWGLELGPASSPIFLSCFPIIMRSGCVSYPMALKNSEDCSFHL